MKRNTHNCLRTLTARVSLGGLVMTGCLHSAVTFTVSDVGPALNSTTPPTTNLAGATVSSSIAAAPGPITYTLSNVDLTDLGGMAAETIVFAVSFSLSSGSVAYNTIPNGNVYNGAGTIGNQIETGEDLTSTVSLVSSTFLPSAVGLFFTSITIGGVGAGESWNVVHDSGTVAGAHPSNTFAIPSSTAMTIQDVATTGSNAGVNLQGYVITFTVIPEPGTALLGSMGMLALLRRRR